MSSIIPKEIKIHLQTATRIYFIANENYHYSNYFSSWKNRSEQDYVTNSSHLKFISHSLWRVSIIEISKLVSDSNNQKFNLNKLIRKVRHSKYSFPDKDFLVKKWGDNMKLINSDTKNLKDIRDKIYAHTDYNNGALNFEIDFTDIHRILSNCWSLIFDLNFHLLGSHHDNKLAYFDGKVLDIVEVLSRARDERLNQLYNSEKSNDQ